ncbi:hypothetical protein DFQ14_10710 [Halopolyspora algeriensis]|uniref:Putative T7SS secretion signal domain-containing protein n=1 Tax=Halopolyspora algeriensis TaxID=1500506 RepID=A0A368VUI9_9ACTN|nr:hypothetical protein [Halopolyspora algeriensis]RCW43123.1 hypothetical protein DFQ14_10710 [Halopolyspora algeriensis]TQM56181.1 hypothetical protein FHU43_0974 [Halopolyspora algeriensis]
MSGTKYPSLGFDPARGNVAMVRDIAEQMTDTGKYSEEAYDVLKSVQGQRDVWTGEAARAFAEDLGELPKYLNDAHSSLEAAGKALRTWGDRLEEHQKEAVRLEQQARQALEDYNAKNAAAEAARSAAVQQADSPELRDSATKKINAANDAWGAVEAIRKKAEALQDTWEDDARTCSKALNEAAEKAPNKAFFESFGELFDDPGKWFKDHLGDLGDIAGIVSTVAGALALIPAFIPIAGPIALAAGGVALAAHGGDMVANEKYDDPNAWMTVGGDVLGVLPGVGAVSKGFNAAGDVVAGVDRVVDVTRTTGAAGMLDTAGEAVAKGSKGFSDEIDSVVRDMKEPAKAFQWVAEKAVGGNQLLADAATAGAQESAAKVLQGGTDVALQVPSGVGLFEKGQDTTDAKNSAGAAGAILSGIQLK